jgi:hypothetical protein
MRLYRAALRCYPRAFRQEYGDDMVALLEVQLRDEHAVRVLGRAVLDLLVTVPTTHMEAHMSRAATTTLVIVLVALGAVLAVVGGPVGILAGLVAFAVAAVTWRRSQPIVADASGTRWWKFLAGGAGLLAALIVVTTITGDLPEGGWYVAMVTMLTSFALIATGLVLGVAARFRLHAA